jgi:hypothetical protein
MNYRKTINVISWIEIALALVILRAFQDSDAKQIAAGVMAGAGVAGLLLQDIAKSARAGFTIAVAFTASAIAFFFFGERADHLILSSLLGAMAIQMALMIVVLAEKKTSEPKSN